MGREQEQLETGPEVGLPLQLGHVSRATEDLGRRAPSRFAGLGLLHQLLGAGRGPSGSGEVFLPLTQRLRDPRFDILQSGHVLQTVQPITDAQSRPHGASALDRRNESQKACEKGFRGEIPIQRRTGGGQSIRLRFTGA